MIMTRALAVCCLGCALCIAYMGVMGCASCQYPTPPGGAGGTGGATPATGGSVATGGTAPATGGAGPASGGSVATGGVPEPTDEELLCSHLDGIGCPEGRLVDCPRLVELYQSDDRFSLDADCLMLSSTPEQARKCGSVSCGGVQ